MTKTLKGHVLHDIKSKQQASKQARDAYAKRYSLPTVGQFTSQPALCRYPYAPGPGPPPGPPSFAILNLAQRPRKTTVSVAAR